MCESEFFTSSSGVLVLNRADSSSTTLYDKIYTGGEALVQFFQQQDLGCNKPAIPLQKEV